MTKKQEDYIVGLNLNPEAIGWAAANQSNNKLLKLQGQTAIGVRLFEKGQTAADRRGFRATRRRLQRRKWRIKLLDEIFDQEMSKLDYNFFFRLKETGLSPLDKNKHYATVVFPTKEKDKEYNNKYSTIYHLRKALMTENRKFDLREIYMALHHIVKYRGNFLQDTPVDSFNASEIDLKKSLNKINEFLNTINPDFPTVLEVENDKEIKKILLDPTQKNQDKKKKIKSLLLKENKKDKLLNQKQKKVAEQVANAILGYKTNFDVLLEKNIVKEDKDKYQFKLSQEDTIDKIDTLVSNLSEAEQNMVYELNKLYGSVMLASLVDEGKTLSDTMIRKYEDHKNDLKLLKKVISNSANKTKAKKLNYAYDLYINSSKSDPVTARFALNLKSLDREQFEKFIIKNLDDSDTSAEIKKKIELGIFLPLQRSKQNALIPYQLNQIEFDKIIENQSKYYPFLGKENPIKDHRKQAPYMLDELIRFKVPYYVGPLITAKDQENTSGANFAWMIRKESGRITPWNFDKKVDRIASANKFIKRMTTKDTYLLGEDVLPANSLTYQKYVVLDELNKIFVNGKKLPIKIKQDLLNNLFASRTTVTLKVLKDYLITNYNLAFVDVRGLADPTKFNSSLSTYNRLRKIKGLQNKLDNKKYHQDFEKIIEWSTIFEDKKIFFEKLKEIEWLTKQQRNELSKIRFRGWGRLSQNLLTGLVDEHGQTILQTLYNTKKTFISIVNSPNFKEQIQLANDDLLLKEDIEDVLSDAYTSPANRKAIRQALAVIKDIVKANKNKAPKIIALNTTHNAPISRSRSSQLKKAYEQVAQELIDNKLKSEVDTALENRKEQKDMYYLYFAQSGRDAYTGQRINIDELESNYEVMHILPEEFIIDNSMDNKILVNKKLKFDKGANKKLINQLLPDRNISVKQMWALWKESGLISRKKFNILLTATKQISDTQKQIYVNRELVDNSQIIKLTKVLLKNIFPESKIISVKPNYLNAVRKNPLYKLYRNTTINDYYFAMDAYLTATIANYIFEVYPKLRPFFVYGEFQNVGDHNKAKNILKSIKNFNFIWGLLKKDAPNELMIKGKNIKAFDRKLDFIENLKKVYDYKYMLISQKTSQKKGQLFGQTLFPRNGKDKTDRKALIPKKNNLDVGIYGGYSGATVSWMTLIKVGNRNKEIYRLVNVPLKEAQKLDNLDNQEERLVYLRTYIQSMGFQKFEIKKVKVPYNQEVIDDNLKYRLVSSREVKNAKELVLSPESQRILAGQIKDNENKSKLYSFVYDEIVQSLDKYNALFDIRKWREKLHQAQKDFYNLKENDQKKVIIAILSGIRGHVMSLKELNELRLNSFGRLPKSVILSPNAQFVYKSPTGLFEIRKSLNNFK